MFLTQFLHNIKPSWLTFLNQEFNKHYFKQLDQFLENEYSKKQIWPQKENIFKTFTFFEVNETRLVILGQDPYHLPQMADGLAFSTKLDIVPKSLANLFKEIKSDLNVVRTNPNLEDIAAQNVLLLNTILTVIENNPMSHQSIGWQTFTQNCIHYLSSQNKSVIYLLMGNNAKSFSACIWNSLAIIETSHPSFYSYKKDLKGKQVFKTINEILVKNKKEPILW
ncbi:MAG: uracil-DNA glycosylase [Malacoplasma sp.]|nr:uracil-DNA glycosylase [Malacoplasma sp.]